MADKSQIIDTIEALAVHCRPPLMEATQRQLWLTDWCSDLAEFSITDIATGVRKWRHSGSVKFPTPGQLLPLIREAIPTHTGPAPQVWRPATEAEYAGMTLRDKIREHQILSHEAYLKAGPMFRNTSGSGPMAKVSGQHLTPDQMPAAHRKWSDIGLNHSQEAHRLRQHLSGRPLGIAAE